MKELEYIGKDMPHGVYKVKDKLVDGLLDSGVWREAGKKEKPLKKKSFLKSPKYVTEDLVDGEI